MRFLLVLTWALALLALSPGAWAQNVSVDNVTRSAAEHETGFVFYVSQEDCLGSDSFRFPTRLENLAGVQSFEVWISEGADCRLDEERFGADASCVRLGSPNGAPEQNTTVSISSAEIAAGIGIVDCVEEGSSGQPRAVSIYFLLVRGGDQAVAAEDAFVWEETRVDVSGPAPPGGVEATEGDGSVRLTFDVPTNTTGVRGFRFYCDDGSLTAPGGAATGAGGGTTSAAGVGGGGGAGGGEGGGGGVAVLTTAATTTATTTTTTTTASGQTNACGTSALIAGEAPDPSWPTCGSVRGAGSGEGVAKGLDNGTPYAIAVVGYDDLGNVGALSEIVCATPFPVDDFYELYREAGGTAGGGLCAVALPGRAALGATAVGGLFVAALGLALRRRAARRGRAR